MEYSHSIRPASIIACSNGPNSGRADTFSTENRETSELHVVIDVGTDSLDEEIKFAKVSRADIIL